MFLTGAPHFRTRVRPLCEENLWQSTDPEAQLSRGSLDCHMLRSGSFLCISRWDACNAPGHRSVRLVRWEGRICGQYCLGNDEIPGDLPTGWARLHRGESRWSKIVNISWMCSSCYWNYFAFSIREYTNSASKLHSWDHNYYSNRRCFKSAKLLLFNSCLEV